MKAPDFPNPNNQEESTFNRVSLLKVLNPHLQGIEKAEAYKAYVLSFNFGIAVTTMKINIEEGDTVVAITNMTTLPEKERGGGHGTDAVQTVVQWAKEQGYQKIIATQVQNDEGEKFWTNNGFEKAANNEETGDFVYTQ